MNVADIVQLVSGGPPMTVLEIKPTTIKCGWFTEGRYSDAWFPPECVGVYVVPAYKYSPQPSVVPLYNRAPFNYGIIVDGG